MNWIKNCACGNADIALLVVRLVLAAVFIAHGISKWGNMTGTVAFFAMLGLPALLAYAVATIELAGGIAMLLGVYTHWAGKLLALVMVGAIVTAKFPHGGLAASELELGLLGNAVAIAMLGSGKYTIRMLLGNGKSSPQAV